MAYTWGVTKWDDPPSSEAPSWRDACERSLGTHPTPGPPSRICHFVGLRRFSHLFSLSEQFEICTRSLFFWEKTMVETICLQKSKGHITTRTLQPFFLVKDVTASQGSQKQEKGEKVPDRLGFLFLVGTRGKFGENSGTSIFTTPGN